MIPSPFPQESCSPWALLEGDVLVSAQLGAETVEIYRQYHMIDLMLKVRVGDSLSITLLRNGEELTVSIMITEACLIAY